MSTVTYSQRGDGVWCVAFLCPGCGWDHVLPVKPTSKPGAAWDWDGNLERPTIAPSILMKAGHYCHADKQPGNCWCDMEERLGIEPGNHKCVVCHSFVRDGSIQFLDDCTHELKGQTVPLPPVENAI